MSQCAMSQVMSQVSGFIWSLSKMAGKRRSEGLDLLPSTALIAFIPEILLAYRRLCPQVFCAVVLNDV